MKFIGIDPGKSGAVAIIGNDGSVTLQHFDKRRYIEIASSVFSDDFAFAVVEKVHAFRGQGVSSCFNFGENFGWIQGVLEANNIPFILVDPRKWQKAFGINHSGIDKSKVKQLHIDCAHRLFPSVCLRRTERCTKDDDGYADALLLAEYGRVFGGR